ncbi:MAG: hypothetical protein ABIA74_05940 [bacterium]
MQKFLKLFLLFLSISIYSNQTKAITDEEKQIIEEINQYEKFVSAQFSYDRNGNEQFSSNAHKFDLKKNDSTKTIKIVKLDSNTIKLTYVTNFFDCKKTLLYKTVEYYNGEKIEVLTVSFDTQQNPFQPQKFTITFDQINLIANATPEELNDAAQNVFNFKNHIGKFNKSSINELSDPEKALFAYQEIFWLVDETNPKKTDEAQDFYNIGPNLSSKDYSTLEAPHHFLLDILCHTTQICYSILDPEIKTQILIFINSQKNYVSQQKTLYDLDKWQFDNYTPSGTNFGFDGLKWRYDVIISDL